MNTFYTCRPKTIRSRKTSNQQMDAVHVQVAEVLVLDSSVQRLSLGNERASACWCYDIRKDQVISRPTKFALIRCKEARSIMRHRATEIKHSGTVIA